jgi:uncharacterized protein YjbJ (UPF0337 family)
MTWKAIEAKWSDFRPSVKARWGKLTDGDLDAIAGRREELTARIQQRYEIEKAAADGEIEEWMREPGVLDDWNDRRPILDM